ncbi:class III extradiol dioxygenase subunit B-like domain-containing protein [Streptomyces sp. NPDC007088]|uniref:class III extradiol dioxygenase subunit B-like domain-containing protein n=1 Tax=Streptomyces sp. NPDC007088 TaxID=3364773 RepID=UPI0036840A56
MLAAAVVCPCPPLLVPEVAAGAAPELDTLRAACADALGILAAARPTRLLVIGASADTVSAGTARHPEGAAGTFRGYGVPLDVRLGRGGERSGPHAALPPSLTVAAALLTSADWTTCPVDGLSVGPARSSADCLETGREAVAGPGRTVLLVMGDGSASRTVKAPGYLDERAEPFDAEAGRALRTADTEALAALDADLARELRATGRAPWQVLSGAASGAGLRGESLYEEAPYGVGYFVAAWS